MNGRDPLAGAPLAAPQDGERRPGQRKIKTTQVVDGHEVEVEIWVDDNETVAWPERGRMRLLNTDLRRVDGPAKVAGEARYPHDVRLPGMLYGRILYSHLPRAKVKIDVAPALALEGVEAALVLRADQVSWLGQPIAAVAARTPQLAADGVRAIRLQLEVEPFVISREQALAADAPAVHEQGNRRSLDTRGDRARAEERLASAAVTVEGTYSVPVQHHVCLETHGVVVDYRGGDEATVYASTQGTFTVPGEAAQELGLSRDKVRCLVPHMGGGFGSKFGLDLPGMVACRLAKQTGRPVHLLLDRPAEFHLGGNRSGARQRLRAGLDADGRLVAMLSEVELHGGVRDGSNAGHPYIYELASREGLHREHVALHAHTDGSRAMRAPGHPQASFATESILDELAYALGKDPLDVRLANLPARSREVYTRQLRRVAQEIGWYEHPHRTTPGRGDGWEAVGIGFALSVWGGGGRPSCEVEVRIENDGSVTSAVGSQDLGTGTATYVAAIPAEVLGLPLEGVRARIGDSRLGSANASGGSTTAASLAPAVQDAALDARRRFADHLAGVLGVDASRIGFEGGRVLDRAAGGRSLSWREACASLPARGIAGQGKFQSRLAGSGVHGAQAARVRVDLLTGAVRVEKMVCMQDVGLPLNRLALKSQIHGGLVQALSYALLEERVIDPWLGLALNANLEDYKIAGCDEIPEMVAILDDDDTRQQVIGMSEAVVTPGASAIANAVHNATGARVRELPLTPDRVLAALAELG